MQQYRITIEPQTAFATALKGDTLFGQMCWAVRHLFGEEQLSQWLNGYTSNKPFMVISDAFPSGFLPRPKMPSEQLGFNSSDAKNRKAAKGKQWLAIANTSAPLRQWHQYLVTTVETGLKTETAEQAHNTINRATGTTGTGQFAPYSVAQTHYKPGCQLDIYACIDTAKIDQKQLKALLDYCGKVGFGKDASTGLGKFTIEQINTLDKPKASQQWLTLAPSCPSDTQLNTEECYYSLFTRFGKHGGEAVQGKPFKNPIVMADAAALLTYKEEVSRSFIGHGLGGSGQLSKQISATVQQGYSPVISIGGGE